MTLVRRVLQGVEQPGSLPVIVPTLVPAIRVVSLVGIGRIGHIPGRAVVVGRVPRQLPRHIAAVPIVVVTRPIRLVPIVGRVVRTVRSRVLLRPASRPRRRLRRGRGRGRRSGRRPRIRPSLLSPLTMGVPRTHPTRIAVSVLSNPVVVLVEKRRVSDPVTIGVPHDVVDPAVSVEVERDTVSDTVAVHVDVRFRVMNVRRALAGTERVLDVGHVFPRGGSCSWNIDARGGAMVPRGSVPAARLLTRRKLPRTPTRPSEGLRPPSAAARSAAASHR
ncbi:hypothetical protein CLV71_124112 [Actinophytocola oryzae]|uniref:Uncharacterized protein n=1 Tax=Actinophytocola oryzae TaxID=502181 RepID=A0A4R7UX43_9PSEU|nr:hypothetical protein CLV71_124112 [Actinophytocola oryzae]